MGVEIYYTTETPADFKELAAIYDALGWNSIGLSVSSVEKMCRQSWYTVYAYDKDKLVGMGRIISDGVITGIICGLCVAPPYQGAGIGKQLLANMVAYCEARGVIPQLMCEENLVVYYERLGFKKFAAGMSKR